MMHSVQGSHAGYNVQSVVDDEHGLIVQAEAVSDANDARAVCPADRTGQ